MEEFLNMGGYGRYVWPSYALAAAVLLWNVWSAIRLQRKALERARRQAAIANHDAQRRPA